MSDVAPPEPTYQTPAKVDSPTPVSPVLPPPPEPTPPDVTPQDAADLERSRRTDIPTVRLSHAGSRTSTMSIPSTRSPFFLVTLFLGVSSWIFGFISQAIVTAQVSNAFIGTLWLAFVLQTILIIWLISALLSPQPFHSSSNTLAHLASMTTVLAAIGVNNNIYGSQPSQKATAAGWLVTAIVDILWVIYFSSPETSPIRYTLDRSWSSGGGRTPINIAVINEEGERAGGFGRLGGKLPPITPPSFRLRSARLRKARRDSAGMQPPDSKFVEEAVGENRNENGLPQLTEMGAEGDNRQSSALRSVSVNPGNSSVGGDLRTDSRPVSSAPSGGPSARGSAGSKAKARAMYSYKGSDTDPHELTFSKGDLFEVVDRSGKWWEAVNKDGKVGIVPSNYMRVVPE
ncbi:hypothetical protein F5887DRAFT_947387 [Amanita rubescens]|nr:hypothetical protein F5887DRAFT_947387 [Amanita rubescens]